MLMQGTGASLGFVLLATSGTSPKEQSLALQAMSTLFLMCAQKVGARCTSVARCAALMLVIYLAVDTLQASARESEHRRAPSQNTYSTQDN